MAPGWAAQAGVADAGVAAFAARAEPGLGTLGSLAGLGGIWNAEAVPASRTSVFAMLSVIALLTIVAIGVPTKISGETLARSQCVTWDSTELENMSEVIVVAIAA